MNQQIVLNSDWHLNYSPMLASEDLQGLELSPATSLGRTELDNEGVECNCACYGGWLCWVKGQLDPDWLPEMQEGQTGNKTKTKPGKQQKRNKWVCFQRLIDK